jgi:hypothetical protein
MRIDSLSTVDGGDGSPRTVTADLVLVAMALLPLRRYPGRLRPEQTDAACPAACCGYLAGITNDTHCPWFLNG